ncbi:unnamed protein product [Microthlaspi erraticum]|uniref:F-box associated beta-propeller type 3 domain-containing protein n=1 Tax=Microthlaspi erraticum TaxID=1685480 RepID=A0A6D2JDA9_9BRAS|nr:unnamed protein product [Microthlaspi erraticum]
MGLPLGGDDWVAPEIPWEIQIEILIRLPAKSLMRIYAVEFLAVIIDFSDRFSALESNHSSYQSSPINRYYCTAASTPRLYMSLMYTIPHESVLLSLSSSSNKDKSLHPELTMPGMGGRYMVVLRGLILQSVCNKARIHNPTTRQSITLPAVKSSIFVQGEPEKHVHYYFGHDPVLDQYKVVCIVTFFSGKYNKIITSEFWVLVLEAGGSWKRIEFDQPHLANKQGLCINGVLYYISRTLTIVTFDVRSEEFSTFQVPHSLADPLTLIRAGFIEYGGKPAIFDHTKLVPMGLVYLWVLEDGGKWSNKSLVLQPRQMRLFHKNSIPLIVHGTTQNGEVIMAPYQLLSPYYIFYYHVEKNDLRKVRIRGIPDPDYWFGKPHLGMYFRIMDKSESIMHLEI